MAARRLRSMEATDLADLYRDRNAPDQVYLG